MPDELIRDRIYSNEYADLIIYYNETSEEFLEAYRNLGAQIVGNSYAVFHVNRSLIPRYPLPALGYYNIPKLFTLLDTTSLEVSGILRSLAQPVLNLDTSNVIMGFIDTGIDYTLDVFRNQDGTSRIIGIWDQTAADGPPPNGFLYGTSYTNEQITAALRSEDPLSIIPERDENGHGTMMAGVAAGSPNVTAGFTGAVPNSPIAMVKLKPAKQYLRDFFLIQEEAIAFQETDIMLGIRYLYQLAQSERKALVICIGVGTNQGSHSGDLPLSSVLSYFSGLAGIYCTIAGGNEAGKSHHYYGIIPAEGEMQDAEILVNEKDKGFSLELWARSPDLFAVSFISPLGEKVPVIPPRLGQHSTINFVLERTIIDVDYTIVETFSGGEMIFMRFTDPTPGLWTVQVHSRTFLTGAFHMWLPISGFISPDTVFLAPNPDTTLTCPSTSWEPITVSTYNAYNNSLFINSSRGFTRTGDIKPDLAAPGVDVTSPISGNQFVSRTGSSIAASITAGAVAILVAWGMTRPVPRLLGNEEIKNFLFRGAARSPDLTYPNREWGYGKLNVYRIFETLM